MDMLNNFSISIFFILEGVKTIEYTILGIKIINIFGDENNIMLNYNKKENKKMTKKTIIITFSIIAVIVLSAVFIINSKMAMDSRNKAKALEDARIKKEKLKKIMDRRESLLPKENKVLTPGEVAPWNIKRTDGRKVAYLTFDDGPSTNTIQILQILDQNKIKANFFLIGSNAEKHPELVKKEVEDGEVVGNHTYSHQLNYREGPENFVKDLDRCDNILKSIIGKKYDSKLVRFPGGSFGPKLQPFRDEATKAGYRYLDWNDETGDADSNNPPVPVLLNNIKKYTQGKNVVVILMHDTKVKTNTVQALPQVIEYLRSQNFNFETIQ